MYVGYAYYYVGPNWMTGSRQIASALIAFEISNKHSKLRDKECPGFILEQVLNIVDVATRFHKSWKRTEHDAQIKKRFSMYWSTIIFQDTNVSTI